MTGITKKEQELRHKKVDSAILESIEPTASTVHDIARQTGEHPTLVHRRFLALGFEYTGRWIYKGNKEHE